MDREFKGNSLIGFPENFTVIDTDCTGYHYGMDELVGISALRIINGEPADSFHSLMRPDDAELASLLTGYSEEELSSAPLPITVLQEFNDFVGSDILVGHNVNFDINFVYDYMQSYGAHLSNDYIDTLRLSRRLVKSLEHHRLIDLIEHFALSQKSDLPKSVLNCQYTFNLFNSLKDEALKQYPDIDAFKDSFRKKKKKGSHLKASDFTPNDFVDDEDNPFYKKYITFTGTLEKMPRKEAMRIVANMGGICKDSVIEKTNYLILGNNDYNPMLKGKKSSKLIKAEKMKAEGKDIEILSESLFYDLLNEWC